MVVGCSFECFVFIHFWRVVVGAPGLAFLSGWGLAFFVGCVGYGGCAPFFGRGFVFMICNLLSSLFIGVTSACLAVLVGWVGVFCVLVVALFLCFGVWGGGLLVLVGEFLVGECMW